MTVKLECVCRHVAHDWKEAGRFIIGCIVVLAAFVIIAMLIYGAGVLLYEPGTTLLIAFCKAFTAYNIMIVLSTTNVICFTFGVAYCWNKDAFRKMVTDTDTHGTPLSTKHEEIKTTWDVVFESAVVEALIYGCYVFCGIVASWFSIYYEQPLLILLAWAVCAVIGIPIACAIARCKE